MNAPIEVSDINHNPNYIEAQRLFKAFISFFPEKDFWGDPVAVEKLLPEPQETQPEQLDDALSLEGWKYLPNWDQVARIRKELGVRPLTGRLDMVTTVNEEQADRMRKRLDIEVKPGKWIIDWKSAGSRDESLTIKYKLHTQFQTYPLLWNACFPEDPVEGLLGVRVVKHKNVSEKSFQVVPVRTVSLKEQLALSGFYESAQALAGTDAPLGIAWDCIDFFKPCPHYVSGRCDRT